MEKKKNNLKSNLHNETTTVNNELQMLPKALLNKPPEIEFTGIFISHTQPFNCTETKKQRGRKSV